MQRDYLKTHDDLILRLAKAGGWVPADATYRWHVTPSGTTPYVVLDGPTAPHPHEGQEVAPFCLASMLEQALGQLANRGALVLRGQP